MIGDVVFFRKNSSFTSKVIAKMTKSEFTHVGLIIGYDKENKIVKIVESNRFVNTRIDTIELKKCKHVVYTTVEEKTQEQIYAIMNLAYKFVGVKYDYWQIIGLFFSLLFKKRENAWFNSKNKLICSELIDIIYYKAGIKRKGVYSLGNVTPQELFEVYDFRIRKEV
jgi:hypothetical protein